MKPLPTAPSTYDLPSRRQFERFEDWSNYHAKILKREQKRHAYRAIKIVNQMNSPRRGPKYIPNTPGYVIEARGACKWFANKVGGQYAQVLHDINVSIKEGEFVVVLGYSGSGKSTLLNLLSGIDRPSNGQVIVSGYNLICLNERELTEFRKDNLSFIFQNYALLSELTVRENIMQGAALQENVYKRLDLDELVDLIGIKEHLDKNIFQLSGGQQQRVAIVKSIIKNPKILFADEPTASVDKETAQNVLKIFSDINKRYNTTIVLITHNPIIAQLATKRIHIERGRIVKCIKQTPVNVEDLPWATSGIID